MQDKATSVRYAERSCAQVLAEGLACSIGLFGWFIGEASQQLSMGVDFGRGRVDFQPTTTAAQDGYDFLLLAGYGEARIAFTVSVLLRFDQEAAETARQAGLELKANGAADLVFPVLLVAERKSLAAAKKGTGYKVALALEDARAAFDAEASGRSGELGDRLVFQRKAFERALTAMIAGLNRVEEAPLSFMEAYLALIADKAPNLPIFAAAEQAAVSGASDKLVFDVETLPRWGFMPPTRLAHHLRLGLATILIENWGEDIDGLAAVMEPTFAGTDYKLALAPSRTPGGAPGVLVVTECPPLDPDEPFDGQRQLALECLAAIRGLRAWYTGRRSAARYWAEQADPSLKVRGDSRVRRDLELG